MLNFKNTILNSSISTKCLVVMLMFMFLDYAGYGYYVFYASFIYLFLHSGIKQIDLFFCFLLCWGIIYGTTNFLNTGRIGYSNFFFFVINCPVLYLLGKYLAKKNCRESHGTIIFIFVLSLAVISILSVLKDIQLNGFYVVDLQRNVPLIGIGNSENDVIAATGISSRLMPLVFFLVFFLVPISKSNKILYVFFAALSLFCAVRVQSRTTILILPLIMILFSLKMLYKGSAKEKIYVLLGTIFVIYVVFYVLNNYSNQLAILERLEQDDIDSGGGRAERALRVISLMPDYPFGGMKVTYAHNIWLDCARVAGILPFVGLILISLFYLRILYQYVRNKSNNYEVRITFSIVSLAVFVVCFVEPVLEGIPMVFCLFCLMCGMMVPFRKYR